jgi:uncharacterized protein YyaL (SSP411 family)
MSHSPAPHARPTIPAGEELRRLPPDGGPGWNRLVFEQSPYLLQHAANPVAWWPWCDEAFECARAQDKPVFLSVGYSTCHWCHVMERESFEDPEVAAVLNEHMIAIKVDREERPDIDHVYMTVTQAMTGQGGWPMTVVMTPDRKPFFAGTYFPKHGTWGRPGMLDLVPALARAWKQERAKVLTSADQIAEAIGRLGGGHPGDAPDEQALRGALRDFAAAFDRVHGGFGGGRNKFPVPHNQSLLLRLHRRFNDANALAMVEKTLHHMRLGGIWDHIGFGFHRYSTDDVWLLPHFEKMLYDQALHALSCVEAFAVTRQQEYARTTREIFAYVLRDMTAPEGGFYSAEDADSEGVEGKFYVWTPAEVAETLDAEDAALFCRLFQIVEGGNFADEATGRRTGESIPHLRQPLAEIAKAEGRAPEDLEAAWEAMRQRLFGARERRVHPYKDDKVLTDWNGLMIAALARGGAALDAPEYVAAARRAADHVLGHLRTADGRLLKRARGGNAGLPAHLEDYAFVVWGLLELYEATFEARWLEEAVALNACMVRHFHDAEGGGFFHTADDSEALLVRTKDGFDGAIPSGNGVAACNLARLGRLTGDAELERLAWGTLAAFGASLVEQSLGHSQMLIALDFLLGPPVEIVLAGEHTDATLQAMAREARGRLLPGAVLLHRPPEDDAAILRLAPFMRELIAPAQGAVAYVCRHRACELPVRTLKDFRVRLDALAR